MVSEEAVNIAIRSANLGSFDSPVEPVTQETPHQYDYHCYTDTDFPPITGLTGRYQYRIPKYWGWQLSPGRDAYLWLDGSMSLTDDSMLQKWVDKLENHDMVVFNHPWRHSIQEESDHIEEHLKRGKGYIWDRYQNGLHREQLADIQSDPDYKDDHLYASMAFMYRDTEAVRSVLKNLWIHQTRYFTCDQLAFTYCLKDLDVVELTESPFKSDKVTLVSKHG